MTLSRCSAPMVRIRDPVRSVDFPWPVRGPRYASPTRLHNHSIPEGNDQGPNCEACGRAGGIGYTSVTRQHTDWHR